MVLQTIVLLGVRMQNVKSNSSLREWRTAISDFWYTFSYTPDMPILWYIIIFWLKLGTFSQIRFWKKFLIFLGQNFFWNFFEKIFFAINQPKKEFKAKKKFSKRGLFFSGLWGYLTSLTKRLKIFLCLFNKKVIRGGPWHFLLTKFFRKNLKFFFEFSRFF